MSHIPEFENARQELLRLRLELTRQRERALTPGIAHALRLADHYVVLALGYTGHTELLFPEQESPDGGEPPRQNLR